MRNPNKSLRSRWSTVLVIGLSAAASCAKPVPVEAPAPAPVVAAPLLDPFAGQSALPYHLPPFDQILRADFRLAFDTAIAEHRAEIDAIAHNPVSPTFENTFVDYERAGRRLTRVEKAFDNLVASQTNDELQAIDAELSPKRAAHDNAIMLDEALFARLSAVYNRGEMLHLDAESAQLLERTYQGFVHAGARLGPSDKVALATINERLSVLSTQLDQNVLEATTSAAVEVDDLAMLRGLSEADIAAAASAASARGLEGRWLLTLVNTTTQPWLSTLEDRALREKIYRASTERATGGPNDNTAVVAEVLKLRARKAELLGHPNYASYALTEETAGTTAAVNTMLADLGQAAIAKAKQEAAEIQKVIDAEAKANGTPRFELQPWDWQFYAEKVRKSKFDFDEAQVRPYFELEHVLKDGVFYAAGELFGVTFEERRDLPVYAPSVRVFDVANADGTKVGLFLLDLYARDEKEGGAWMDTLVDQSQLFDERPVVVNNTNVKAPAAGQPALLSFDEVETLFHEFGHGVHGLFSNVRYPSLSGTNTPPDYVEFPSQFYEMWQIDPAVLANYAKHYETGEPMPKELLDKVLAATRFGRGYLTAELVEAAVIDQALHQLAVEQVPSADGLAAFEAAVLKKAGLTLAAVPPRYHTPYFSHIFDGDYAAGYYAYLWSEVLARNAGAWFYAHGGLTRANGDVFRTKVLERGRSAEPDAMFRDFHGGPPTPGPLLEYRGLTAPRR